MICFPNAKINLGLNIISKREDGYHNLETVFYPVPLCDALEIIEAEDGQEVFVELGKVTGSGQQNLAMKALNLFRQFVTLPPLKVYLYKNIPFGAGLGGGSADASFMLKLLNEKFESNKSDDFLEALALRLGADCPFFIANRPSFATGIGDIMQDIEVDLKPYTIVILKPDFAISTAKAYSLVKPHTPALSLKDVIQQPIEHWKDNLVNDFETALRDEFPKIEILKNRLYQQGAIYASLSGSGSAIYGIFAQKTALTDFENCDIYYI